MVLPNLEPEVSIFKLIEISQSPGHIEGRQSLLLYVQIFYTCIGKLDLLLVTKTVTFVLRRGESIPPGIFRPLVHVQ